VPCGGTNKIQRAKPADGLSAIIERGKNMVRDYYDTPEGKRQLHLYLMGVNDAHLPRSKRSRQRRLRRESLRLIWGALAIGVIIIAVVMQ